ncbi:MAG TPA: anhydro-N-acetylmuramic acid kinase [Candidatus Angelobacter sp.]|nr:anhydro-N-acetylmuramic acid kinase [Candidatus Angelobacter sp.]
MIVAGVMSGTSADGVDVAFVRLRGLGSYLHFELLGHHHLDYPKSLRQAVLGAMNAGRSSVGELSRLNFRLGEFYADAVRTAQKKTRTRVLDLVGCHGQTIYHQGDAAPYLGKKITCTWQTGEGSVVATQLGVPVVSDFRPADMAAGGKGAPLVPFLDYAVFRDKHVGRIVQNIGGIANLTAISADAKPDAVIAFDTGPGNMVIDQLMQMLFNQPFDRNGAIAKRGEVIEPVLEEMLRASYFKRKPPKTAGREEFGREYARAFLRRCGSASKADVIATATALTPRSIAAAIDRFVLPGGRYRQVVVSGGGSKNATLMKMLVEETAKMGLRLRQSDDYGVPSQAKEAVAFALLAYQTWHRQPGNVPSATGAEKAVVLGKISYV